MKVYHQADIAIMIYIWFIWHRMYGWQSGVKIKTLLKIAVAVLAFIFIFFGIRNIVGRNDSRSLLYVITHYFGAPIQIMQKCGIISIALRHLTVLPIHRWQIIRVSFIPCLLICIRLIKSGVW